MNKDVVTFLNFLLIVNVIALTPFVFDQDASLWVGVWIVVSLILTIIISNLHNTTPKTSNKNKEVEDDKR